MQPMWRPKPGNAHINMKVEYGQEPNGLMLSLLDFRHLNLLTNSYREALWPLPQRSTPKTSNFLTA